MTDFLGHLDADAVFFFAGSGISYGSGLPSADALLRLSAASLLTELTSAEHEAIVHGIQPEIFYEALIEALGDRSCLDIWSILHPDVQRRMGCLAVPSLAHYAIVGYSHGAAVPIFTTNFDCMFEEAARHLGVDFDVYRPGDALPRRNGRLAICKLHGSIADGDGRLDLDSLWTTATEISTFNGRWIGHIVDLMAEHHIAFVGYSGRDIDLFPHLRVAAVEGGARRPYWLNEFGPTDPSRPRAVACGAVMVPRYPDFVFTVAGLACSRPSAAAPDPEAVAEGMSDLAAGLGRRFSVAGAEQVMFRALIHSHAGRYRDADQVLAGCGRDAVGALPPKRQAHFHLARARSAHERSRYVEVGRHGRRALVQAIKAGAVDEMVHALTTISESWRMRVPADTCFPAVTWRTVPVVLFAIGHFLAVAVAIGIILCVTARSLARLKPHARHAVLEHAIRFLAILQVAWRPVIGRLGVVRNGLRGVWMRLFDICHHHGYGAGMANCYKFAFRIAPDVKQELSGTIYQLFSHHTGIQLTTRNAADAAREQGRYDEALDLYRAFLESSDQCGNTLNAVKALLGIFKVRMLTDCPVIASQAELARFDDLSRGVEGPLWQRHFHRVRRTIVAASAPEPMTRSAAGPGSVGGG